ncbi:MAG: HDIG domain-containing protein, partial [Clostridia bacterium]|nr:HDIG domain-containing protein [Clostridia bacterium]
GIAIAFVVGWYYNVFARPYALCAQLGLLLINRRTAIFMNMVVCLMTFMLDAFTTSLANPDMYSALVIGYTTSLLAIYLVYGIRSRLKVFLMGLVMAIPVSICCIALNFELFLKNPLIYLAYGVTSGMLSVVLMMALLPFCERIFVVVTHYSLAEITDHKSTLIKLLIQYAPGTFNHSLIVSTLAESCANAIGEDALLARACAYYHDIGKLKNPEFFTENQQGYNPHDELSPELSTDIIRSHAKDGYDLIKKYHLPQILADVAMQHHGTLPIRYFYDRAQKFTEGELDIANFSYPGPKPQTKIAAIIMIADGAEAKVRTLPVRSHEKVDAAVKEIIKERMDFGQFTECEITMKDIDIIRATITNSLAGVYHDRVEYPKLKLGKRI